MEQRVLSLEQPFDGEEDTSLGDLIATPNEEDPVKHEWLEQKELISELLTYLNPIEKQIILLRYHLVEVQDGEKDPCPRPYAVVARLLGKMQRTVQAKEQHAFLKLRYGAAQLKRKEQGAFPEAEDFR